MRLFSVTASIVPLALWIGAVLFFAAFVAPAAFRVLPSRALAGALVGETLPVLFLSGILLGLLLAGLALAASQAVRGRTLLIATGALIVLACAIAQFGVGARFERLRAELPHTVELLPADDPRRAEFGRLHGLAVALLGVAFLSASTALVVLTTTRSPLQPAP